MSDRNKSISRSTCYKSYFVVGISSPLISGHFLCSAGQVVFFLLCTSDSFCRSVTALHLCGHVAAHFPTRPVEQHAERARRLSGISSSVSSSLLARCFSTLLACICQARSGGGILHVLSSIDFCCIINLYCTSRQQWRRVLQS